MEDPFNHRITANWSTISANTDSTRNALAHWIHESYNASLAQPIYTRVQNNNSRGLDFVKQYQDYRISWTNLFVVNRQQELVTVCFVGDSHSRRGVEALIDMGLTKHNINATHVEVKFLRHLLNRDREEKLKSLAVCDRMIFAAGQWDFSHHTAKFPRPLRVTKTTCSW